MKERCGYMWSPTDWRNDDIYRLLTTEERGGYRELIDECWVNGSIPGEPELIARLAGWSDETQARVWPLLAPKFVVSGADSTRLILPRLEKDRVRLLAIRKKRRHAGRVGAETRWSAHPKHAEKQTTSAVSPVDSKCYASAIANPMAKNSHIQIHIQGKEGSPFLDSSNPENIPGLLNPSLAEVAPVEKPPELDETFEIFKAGFEANRSPAKYQSKRGDFVQIASLRKRQSVAPRASPPQWQTVVDNYFASDLAAYTLADCAARYDVFVRSPVDRFNRAKPQAGFPSRRLAEFISDPETQAQIRAQREKERRRGLSP